MGGLAVLLIIAAYVAFAVVIVRAIKATRWKFAAVVAAILIPTADAVTGRIYLAHLCRSEAGASIHRTVDGVEGFLADIPDQSWITAHGYRFSEGVQRGTARVNRYIRRDERIEPEWDSTLTLSTFRVRTELESPTQLFPRQRMLVEDLKTGEALASYTQVSFRGGWAESFLGRFADSGPGYVAWCEMQLSAHERWNRKVQMILKTLPPKR